MDLYEFVHSVPAVLSVIPHQGAAERLEKAYQYLSTPANPQYEVGRHLEECRKKIKERERQKSGQ